MPKSEERRRVDAMRWQEYKALCEEAGVPRAKGNGTAWYHHYKELLENFDESQCLTREEEFAYWRERLTKKEIQEIGGYLAPLDEGDLAA